MVRDSRYARTPAATTSLTNCTDNFFGDTGVLPAAWKMIIPVGPARNLLSHAAFSSALGFPLRSILGKKYKPSPGSEVRSVATILSSLEMRVKPIPLSSTMCEMPPHANTVAAPASVAISHLYNDFIQSSVTNSEHTTMQTVLSKL